MYLCGSKPKENAITDWSNVELSLECFMKHDQVDPFEDTDPDPELEYDLARHRAKNLNQMVSHSVLVFNQQHRTRHFTLVFLRARARIILWDRSGLLITPAFDYRKNPSFIAKFLWRFCNASPESRGHDTSAVRLRDTDADYAYMDAIAKKDVPMEDEHARSMFQASLAGTARWKVQVDDREFLIGSAHFAGSDVVGRGTRGYVAVESLASITKMQKIEKDTDKSEESGSSVYRSPFVYLKDCWRAPDTGIGREGDILEFLNKAKVQYIPTLLCHGDIEGQETMTQTHAPRRSFKICQHYRMVTKEVGMPLKTFATGYDLVGYTLQCIVGESLNQCRYLCPLTTGTHSPPRRLQRWVYPSGYQQRKHLSLPFRNRR